MENASSNCLRNCSRRNFTAAVALNLARKKLSFPTATTKRKTNKEPNLRTLWKRVAESRRESQTSRTKKVLTCLAQSCSCGPWSHVIFQIHKLMQLKHHSLKRHASAHAQKLHFLPLTQKEKTNKEPNLRTLWMRAGAQSAGHCSPIKFFSLDSSVATRLASLCIVVEAPNQLRQ